MHKVEIFGARQSTYVRVVWMLCEEKKIPYAIRSADPHCEQIRHLNPFGRIPAMRHGDRVLFESKAIATYLDRTFEGKRLIPEDPFAAGLVEQWISAVNTGIEPVWTHYFRANVFPKGPNGQRDMTLIASQLDAMRKTASILNEVLSTRAYLASDEFTLADIALFPALHYFQQFPESLDIASAMPALRSYYERLNDRPSANATVPPPFSNRIPA